MAGRIAYYGNIVTQGLVLDLDAAIQGSYPKTGSTWFDISNNGNNGTLTNGPLYTGSNYGAIVFDGVDDYVATINQPLDSVTTAVTYTSWYNVTNLSTTRILFSFRDSMVALKSTGVDYWWNVGAVQGSLTTTMPTGSWTNMVLTQNNTSVNLYINGSPVSSIIGGTITTSRTAKAIGQYDTNPAAYGKFLGSIGNAQIYNQSLSQFQVWQNFNAYKSRYGIPDIVTDGLVLNLDAGNPYSYLSGSSGTTWTNTVAASSSISGTLVNGTTYSNGAMVFDGVDDYVVATGGSTSPLNITSSITLESWIKSTALADISHGDGINSKGTSSDGNSGVYETLLAQSGGINYPFFRMRIASSTPTYFPTNIPINLNQIYHFVSTYDGSVMRIFINGVESGTGLSQTGTIEANTQPLGIGVRYSKIGVSNVYFNGSIYSNKIYNRALTQAEITQNFNALRGRYGI